MRRATRISSRPIRSPGLNPGHSDLPILAAQNGIEFTDLIGLILDAGLARYGLSRKAVTQARKRA